MTGKWIPAYAGMTKKRKRTKKQPSYAKATDGLRKKTRRSRNIKKTLTTKEYLENGLPRRIGNNDHVLMKNYNKRLVLSVISLERRYSIPTFR
jgi:hypothetical protein